MRTTVINLWGGPGAGKSTSAAYLFSKLKMAGYDAELVREYVKDWVWEDRKIGRHDQVYFLGKQMKRESMLYGKVEVIVTDAPVMLNSYYAQLHSDAKTAAGIQQILQSFYASDEAIHHHFLLYRSKAYNNNGRFQTEEQAKGIDVGLFHFMNDNLNGYERCKTDTADLDSLLARVRIPTWRLVPSASSPTAATDTQTP